jgi:cytochrome c-type biogenesis protein CcmF
MFPIIGLSALLLAISISIFLPIFSFFSLRRNSPLKILELERISLFLSAATLCCTVSSQLCLIYSFVISDYSLANVYQNSHHLKPLIYKISGSWGNHEGSMLLLLSIISAYSFAFVFLSKIDSKKKIIVASSQSAIIALLAAFTAFTSNPFARIFPTPATGLGLNPLLQDIGLALHPPMLYVGYIGFSLVFSFAIAGLLTEKIDRKFAIHLKNWLFFSYGFLTLGIGLGAWWAYRELGWGGYWFWDPVENISLMPWIAATALIHCLKLLEKKEIFKIWTAFLAILTFILCLLGIFLVRSGILTSVHSFAIDAKRGFFVIALIFLIGGFGLLALGVKMPKLKSENVKIFFWSKIGAILLNNYFLVSALFVVLLGTIYPIFSRSFFGQFISIGPDYYNKIFSFLAIPFLAFLAISNQLSFSEKKKAANLQIALILLSSAMLTSLTFFYQENTDFLQIIILFLAIFSALITIFTGKNSAMKLAHFGFSLIIIGIVLTSSFGLTKEVNLQVGQSLKIANHEVKFSKITYIAGENFLARQGNFSSTKLIQKPAFSEELEGGSDRRSEVYKDIHRASRIEPTEQLPLKVGFLDELTPQLRYYPASDQTTNEASIQHEIFGDLYLVIGNKDAEENYAIRAYYKPFIWLIWFGCALIFSSTIFKIFPRKNAKK